MKKLCLLLLLLLLAPLTHALDAQLLPDIAQQYVTLNIIDPVQRVGYTVGDIITREVTLTVKAPYQLVETSLPIVGYEKRYRGQLIGVELKTMQHHKLVEKASTTHTIRLAYQIFTNNVVAKPVGLGPEYLHLINTKNSKDLVKYRLPLLEIAVSPLAIFGQVKVEDDMSSWHGPLLLSRAKVQKWRNIALGVLVLSLLCLLYILGERAWLPRMGAPFAKAYRSIKKLPADKLDLAIQQFHQALNTHAGMSIFSASAFIKAAPQFSAIKDELERFFTLSSHLYFDTPAPPQALDKHGLLQLTRRARNCERGLRD